LRKEFKNLFFFHFESRSIPGNGITCPAKNSDYIFSNYLKKKNGLFSENRQMEILFAFKNRLFELGIPQMSNFLKSQILFLIWEPFVSGKKHFRVFKRFSKAICDH